MAVKFMTGVDIKLRREHFLKLLRDQGFFAKDLRRLYSARFEDYRYEGLVEGLRGASNVLFTLETPSCHVFGGFINSPVEGVGVYEDPSLRSFLFSMNDTH
jgi:hypothetical protein